MNPLENSISVILYKSDCFESAEEVTPQSCRSRIEEFGKEDARNWNWNSIDAMNGYLLMFDSLPGLIAEACYVAWKGVRWELVAEAVKEMF